MEVSYSTSRAIVEDDDDDDDDEAHLSVTGAILNPSRRLGTTQNKCENEMETRTFGDCTKVDSMAWPTQFYTLKSILHAQVLRSDIACLVDNLEVPNPQSQRQRE